MEALRLILSFSPRGRDAGTALCLGDGRSLFPSPWGEGWGEGVFSQTQGANSEGNHAASDCRQRRAVHPPGVGHGLSVHQGRAGQGAEIFRVFFYHDGVNNGTRFAVPPQDDRNLQKLWTELAEAHQLDLVVCVAAAQRRGILDADEAKRHSKDVSNIAPGFRISGLGQLIEAGIQADRLVVFGD